MASIVRVVMQSVRCNHCHYWEMRSAEIGCCHRNPPVEVPKCDGARFPLTEYSDWCGEFISPKEECDDKR